jgi:class 3 adenylate cyclase/tetratricopeptide (TPR) repeat protein
MSEPRRERKVVTVLFADLVGFTARSEQLDPEDVEAILRPYHERLRHELQRFGGTVEKFIGDAVMAIFGAPVAHEDDPERAVRAALAIRDWAREAGNVQVRIAVNTGEALINLDARPESGEGMAAGDVVNTAARLQAAAPVNGVLVGETTYRATRHVIEYEDAAPVEAKGKTEPIPVWEAREPRARVRTEAVSTSVRVVGRDRELALLRETLDRVRSDSAPQLVTLVGSPGIGKSRLVRELLGFVEESGVLTFWRQGRSLPYGEGATFSALTDILKAQAGILETDDETTADAKLRAAVANLVPEEAEARRLERYLRPLVALAGEDEPEGESPTETFAAWRQFFEAMAEQRPLVVVFEDIQWADDGLLDFVDHLVDWSGRLPILVVCTARPELLERRPGWGGGKLNATTLSLSPLSDEDTARLFAELLGTPVLESEQQRELLTRAGGNPLYAEQFAQMSAQEPDATGHVPETIQGIIAARLDRLLAAEKDLLQDAAVLGKVFWVGGLVDGGARPDVERLLHSLERKEFVQRSRRTSVSNEPEYAFLHVLVRDVAYGQIPRADRAAKHRRAADWIESLGRPDDHAELLAHHYGKALELSRAAGAEIGELAESARVSFRAAGDRATALHAYVAAARFYEEALTLTEESDLEQRSDILFSLGRVLNYTGDERRHETLDAARAALLAIGDADRAAESDALQAEGWWMEARHDRANEHLRRAEALVHDRPPSPSKARVLHEVARFNMVGGRYADALRFGTLALEIAEELGLDDVRANALTTVGTSRSFTRDADGVADLRAALELADRLDLPQVAWRAINNLAIALVDDHGEVQVATELLRDGLRRAERVGDRLQITWFEAILAQQEYWLGHLDAALEHAERVIHDVQTSSHYHEGTAYGLRALIRLARDDAAGAADDADRSVALASAIAETQVVTMTFSEAALVLVRLGRHEEASRLTDQVIARIEALGGLGYGVVILVPLGLVMTEIGRANDFLEFTRQMRESPWLAAARAFATGDAVTSAQLLEPISAPEAAWIRLRAAEHLQASGRRAEADVQLAKALAFWRSVGGTRYVREAEALLPASA